MKSKAIFMALLALAFGARAVPVDVEKAKLAARAWAYRGATLGAQIGDNVESAATHRTTNGVPFFVIRMKGGGTVFMSSDTEVEPVICFTSNPGAEAELDSKSPLWALLNADLSARGKVVAPAMAAGGSAAVPQSRTAKLWADLIREGGPNYIRPSFAGEIKDQKRIGDLRVAPLVQSQWSQSTDNKGKACWNYYTPPGPDGNAKNAVCGCVATAMSQVMLYHKFPNDAVDQVMHTCTYNDAPISLTTQAGTYDWDAMTLRPNATSSMAAKNYQAIGKLTSDAGITVFMQYTDGESGAYGFDITYALMHHWHYKNSVFFDVRGIQPQESGNADRDKAFQKALFANFDAGYPVCMGIPGHAIVADGYGYNGGVDYVHLNMGWAGQSDYWYNLPNMANAHPAFTAVEDISYNIFPDKDRTYGIISGRLIDAETGKPCVDAEVTLKRNGSSDEVKVRTTATGVYGAAVKAGTYLISAVSSDGTKAGTLYGEVTVESPTTTLVNWNYLGRLTPSVYEVGDLGNSWGNDFTVEDVVYEGSVRNVTQGGTLYGTLDAALDAANANDEIEILSETLLRYPQAVTKSVLIRTAGEVDPAAAVVHCRVAAAHGFTSVTNGATLALENVVFANTKGCFVHVHSNAFLSVSGTIGLSDGSYVHTEDEKGIQLAGELESYLTVDCLVAKGRDQQFGTCSAEAFAASASHFLNPYDEDLGGEVLEGKLIWARVPVDPSIAIAYFTDDAGDSKQYYRKLTTLFEDHAGEKGDVVILKDCELKASASVTSSMRLVCTNETGAATVTYAPDTNALISVEAEASLSVSNVVLSGATYRGAILVRGGELTLERDTVITNCVNNFHDDSLDDLYAGAGGVTVSFDDSWNPGHATVMPGVLITMCQTVHGAGGGIFVEGDISPLPGCSLDLQGGTIELCKSSLNGGGVCAQRGTEVLISGDVRIRSNVSEQTTDTSKEIWDNLFVADASVLTLDGALTAGETIGLRCAGTIAEFGGVAGEPFGLIADGLGVDASVTNSATLFRSDDLPNVWHGAVGTDEGGNAILVWDDSELPEVVPVPEDVAVRVIYEYGGLGVVTNLYDMLDKALASIHEKKFDGPVTVELCADHDELVMSNGVNLVSSVIVRTEDNAYGKAVKVIRAEKRDTTISVSYGADLLLTNVWLYGGCTATVAVRGGALTMESGAVISDMSTIVTNLWSREHSGVSVGEGGVFTMRDGAEIACCTNLFESSDGSQLGPAGGVAVEGVGAVFNLEGGWIHGCAAGFGGGVFINNDAKLFVSGNPRILDNYLLSDPGARGGPVTNANLSVACESFNEGADKKAGNLILTGEFTGAIGMLEPRLYRPDEQVNVDTNVFGRVDRDAGDPTNFVDSASLFHRDAAPSVTGLVVTNADPSAEALLVWSTAVKDGVYTDKQGNVYLLAGEPTPRPVPPPQPQWDVITNKPSPIAFRSIDRISDTEWTLVITNREPYCNYRLIWTTDLTKGFTSTGKWEKASGTVDPVWTTNVITTGGAWFWRAEGTEGTNMVPHQVEGK